MAKLTKQEIDRHKADCRRGRKPIIPSTPISRSASCISTTAGARRHAYVKPVTEIGEVTQPVRRQIYSRQDGSLTHWQRAHPAGPRCGRKPGPARVLRRRPGVAPRHVLGDGD